MLGRRPRRVRRHHDGRRVHEAEVDAADRRAVPLQQPGLRDARHDRLEVHRQAVRRARGRADLRAGRHGRVGVRRSGRGDRRARRRLPLRPRRPSGSREACTSRRTCTRVPTSGSSTTAARPREVGRSPSMAARSSKDLERSTVPFASDDHKRDLRYGYGWTNTLIAGHRAVLHTGGFRTGFSVADRSLPRRSADRHRGHQLQRMRSNGDRDAGPPLLAGRHRGTKRRESRRHRQADQSASGGGRRQSGFDHVWRRLVGRHRRPRTCTQGRHADIPRETSAPSQAAALAPSTS